MQWVRLFWVNSVPFRPYLHRGKRRSPRATLTTLPLVSLPLSNLTTPPCSVFMSQPAWVDAHIRACVCAISLLMWNSGSKHFPLKVVQRDNFTADTRISVYSQRSEPLIQLNGVCVEVCLKWFRFNCCKIPQNTWKNKTKKPALSHN